MHPLLNLMNKDRQKTLLIALIKLPLLNLHEVTDFSITQNAQGILTNSNSHHTFSLLFSYKKAFHSHHG
jgi:hypothetical protein